MGGGTSVKTRCMRMDRLHLLFRRQFMWCFAKNLNEQSLRPITKVSQKLTGRRKHAVLTISIGCGQEQKEHRNLLSAICGLKSVRLSVETLKSRNGTERWLSLLAGQLQSSLARLVSSSYRNHAVPEISAAGGLSISRTTSSTQSLSSTGRAY